MATNGRNVSAVIDPVSNDAEFHIEGTAPYQVLVRLQGTSDILFHAWSCEDVEEKAKAAKGSKAKKTDNLEAYVYRCSDGTIGITGEYLRQAIIGAAKYHQDPRSPRKSAQDLFKAGVVSLTETASLGRADWDYISRKRVQIQRNAVTRQRPAFLAGWEAEFDIQILLPEYISPLMLKGVIENAGRLVGLADFRPTYGRFTVTRFDVVGP